MHWEVVKDLSPEEFRRLTGVKKQTFDEMLKVLKSARKAKLSKGGRNPKNTTEEVLLMTLEYLREYRTYFHISKSYGISESNCYYIVRFVEDSLIKSGHFNLPGRKALLKSDVSYEAVLVDATESPVQRPKKSKNTITPARKSDTL